MFQERTGYFLNCDTSDGMNEFEINVGISDEQNIFTQTHFYI